MRWILSIALLVILASCGPSANEAEKNVSSTRPPTQAATTPLPRHKLTGPEVTLAVVGNTSYTYGVGGAKTQAVYYRTDGRVTVTIKPDFKDSGTYKISGDGIVCSIYSNLRGGVETCQSAYRVDATTLRWLKADGSTFDENVVLGNAENL